MEENFMEDYDAAFDLRCSGSADYYYDIIMSGMVDDDAIFTQESANAVGLKKLANNFNLDSSCYYA